MYRKLLKYSLIVLAVVAIIIGVYLALRPSEDDRVDVRPAEIRSVEELADLCTYQIYNEISILDTIDNKVMFAIQKQVGSIRFDLDDVVIDSAALSADTLRIALPPEKIELRESTEPGSWTIVDTKAIGPFSALRSDRLSVRQENILKTKAALKSRRRLYENGTVAQARREAAESLRRMLEIIYKRPVDVVDPTPAGAHFRQN